MRRSHHILIVVLVSVLGLGVAPADVAAPPDKAPADGLEPGLLADLEAGRTDRFVVELAGRADLRAAARNPRAVERTGQVVASLQATYARSGPGVMAAVARAGARGTGYWLTNSIVVDGGGAALAEELARHRDVTTVRAERSYPLVKPVDITPAVLPASVSPEWGVAKIGADGAWDNGVLGSGVVVANIDTGVSYLHEALVTQYRGNNGNGTFSHDHNWWDPTGICGSAPCDNAEHGTHTMGTIVGGDGPGPFSPDIGVAPGATWVAAKGCEDFGCSEEALLSSGQWVLAPTALDGSAADPAKRPDIVNNSWGGGPGDSFYEETVAAWRAAGIIPVFSSGNPGPTCGQGGSPGDFLESVSVGATDSNDLIAGFSGRGPSSYGKVNPDVAAPGVDVLSSVPGGYAEFSGTSMAAPHVAGTLALMLSAEPALLGDIDGAVDALKVTAKDILDGSCGGDDDLDPNNVYGDGRIDAAAAVALVATGGTLAGTVTDDGTSTPIPGARITATSAETGRSYHATSLADGTYTLFLPAGAYTVAGTAFAYAPFEVTGVTIVTDETTIQDLSLVALPRYPVSGVVNQAEDGAALERASVTALATPLDPAVTDVAGAYTLLLPDGTWTLRARAGGCTDTVDLEVTVDGGPVAADLALARKLDDHGHTCRAIALDWVDAPNESSMFGDDVIGRFALPFPFSFYGTDYSAVFVSDNGYLSFRRPDGSDPFPIAPPSTADPNAAVFALWQNLRIDADAAVGTGVVGEAPNRAFVIEWDDLAPAGGTARVDLEVKLWEDGIIDVLYGDNPPVADGRNAVIGLENGEGTDAFAFGAFTSTLQPQTAYRYETAELATVTGTVTDANDGEPVAGATVTATPGLRTATTADDGTYTLGVLPGSYTLEIEAAGYVAQSFSHIVAAGDVLALDAVLDAPVATLAPTAINLTNTVGTTKTRMVTISNPGTAPLAWELRERTTPQPTAGLDRAAVTGGTTRPQEWGRADYSNAPTAATVSASASDLEVVIDDPIGDASGVDLDDLLASSDGQDVTFALRMATPSSAANAVGFVLLDLDQDPTTGDDPEWWFGDPDQDIGVDVILDLWDLPYSSFVYVFDPLTFEFLGAVEATIDGTDIVMTVPTDMLYGDDGSMDVAGVVGTEFAPTDWFPDAGHGTIEPFTDVPWITPSIASGVLAPSETVAVSVTIGGASLQPGSYSGRLVLVSDAPRQPRLTTTVDLTIPLPSSWGEVRGTVVDARTYDGLDAGVVIAAQHAGAPLAVSTTASFGEFQLYAPRGSWPLTATQAGYLDGKQTVTVRAGQITDVFLEMIPIAPQAGFDLDGLDVLLERGGTTTASVQLRNDGPVNMTFGGGEVNLGSAARPSVTTTAEGGRTDITPPTGDAADAMTTQALGRKSVSARTAAVPGDVLASWPTMLFVPWGVGYDGNVVIGDPDQGINARFTRTGARIGEFPTPWAANWAADLAYDPGRNLLWQVNVGGDNGIYGLNPSTGAVVHTITGSPWGDTSQRGLAYDPDSDTFYIGGWNEGIIYRVAGLSWPTPGATLSQCFPDDPDIAGLAYNRAFGALWMTTNSESDTIWLLDASTCTAGYTLEFPDFGGYLGAGIELDAVGNLWVASQGGDAFLLESGVPLFSDVPWLTVTPTNGTVKPGDAKKITLAIDAGGLSLGTHHAMYVLTTNDPLAGAIPIPVTLTVARDVPGDDIVTIAAVEQAAEPNVNGLVRVTRNEPFRDLTVKLRVGGTVVVGEDVGALPDTVTFRDGKTTVDVPVTVLDDDRPEGPETLSVAVVPSSRYHVGSPRLAVVTFGDDEVTVAPGVHRLAGESRFGTAVAVSQDSFAKGAADAVVLTRADDFADGLAGGPLAAAVNGPLLLTPHGGLEDLTRAELERVLPAGKTVYLLGGPAAISEDVTDELRGLGYRPERIAGETRFETAVEIAGHLGEPDLILVAVGGNFPDALAASAAATALNGAVLFSGDSSPAGPTDAFLAMHPEVPRYAIGGPAARGYPSLGPIFGPDRYATAAAVASTFFPEPFAIGLARGDDFPDALTGGVHAGVRAGPVLLTATAGIHDAVTEYLGGHDNRLIAAYLYGGEAVLSPAVAQDATNALP